MVETVYTGGFQQIAAFKAVHKDIKLLGTSSDYMIFEMDPLISDRHYLQVNTTFSIKALDIIPYERGILLGAGNKERSSASMFAMHQAGMLRDQRELLMIQSCIVPQTGDQKFYFKLTQRSQDPALLYARVSISAMAYVAGTASTSIKSTDEIPLPPEEKDYP